jgi:hypothetical protein
VVGVTVSAGKFHVQDDQDGITYIEQFNTSTGASAAVYNRLVTQNAAASGTIASGMIKFRTGEFRLINGETSASGFTSIYVGGTERARITSSGNVGIGTSSPTVNFEVRDSTNGANLLVGGSGTLNIMRVWGGAADALSIGTNGTEGIYLDTSANVGIGTSTPGGKLGIATGGTTNVVAALGGTFPAFTYRNGTATWFHAGKHPSSDYFYIGHGATPTTNVDVVVNGSGNVGIGTSSPTFRLDTRVGGTSNVAAFINTDATGTYNTDIYINNGNVAGNALLSRRANGQLMLFTSSTDPIVFHTNNTERMRIDSSGNVFISKTASSISTPGHELNASGEARHTRDGDNVVGINRLTNDGDLVRFFQASTQEGSISVSGTTVSYNAFAGSHWSRFENGATPEVLVGTLIESTGEQLTWPGEADEKHTFGRICNTVQSRAVAGVFMAYDTDDEHGDFYCTAVGRYLMRVEAGEDPQVGDLLESNGKYARVSMDQTDIKTYHVARVMGTSGSNHAADGSFCVAVELMIGG